MASDDNVSLQERRVLLGVTGSIAAYKSALLIRQLITAGADVQVVMTPDAERFITSTTLGTLSEREVLIDLFPEAPGEAQEHWTKHVTLGQWADLFVVAPATAQTIAKMAHGFSDSMLTATALSATCPVLVCPAMDRDMYEHPATQANLDRLRAYGYRVMPAEHGELASGLVGPGRLPEPPAIVQRMGELIGANSAAPDAADTDPADSAPVDADAADTDMGEMDPTETEPTETEPTETEPIETEPIEPEPPASDLSDTELSISGAPSDAPSNETPSPETSSPSDPSSFPSPSVEEGDTSEGPAPIPPGLEAADEAASSDTPLEEAPPSADAPSPANDTDLDAPAAADSSAAASDTPEPEQADPPLTQDTDSLAGMEVLITAGPTQEPIDPVRVLTNRSTGQMGFALAEVAARRGADVTLVTGPTNLDTPPGVERIDVTTTKQMLSAVEERRDAELIIMAAAVSDYTPSRTAPSKIKKGEGDKDELVLRLRRTPDILKKLGGDKRADQQLVGFALETENGIENARKKLKQKNLDWVALNNPLESGAGFGPTNRVTLMHRDGYKEDLPTMPKVEVAEAILDRVAAVRMRSSPRT